LELKDKEPQYKKKANDYFQEVVTYYPSTTWAKEAQKMLN
jgi:outer membrane protein assembly factor BamD (BamD/ComL family)